MDCTANLNEPTYVSKGQLPHLLVRKTCEKKLLVDYSQSHVVTSNKYLQIML
jgi:hypothetical protein